MGPMITLSNQPTRINTQKNTIKFSRNNDLHLMKRCANNNYFTFNTLQPKETTCWQQLPKGFNFQKQGNNLEEEEMRIL